MKQTTAFVKAPEKYNYLFDENDSRLPALKDDEIALSYVQSIQNDLTVGDKITIKIGELEETFHIAYIMKDMVFGSEYMGLFRVIVSDSMFERLAEEKPAAWNLYSIVSDDQGELLKEFNQNNFQALFEFSRNTLEYT